MTEQVAMAVTQGHGNPNWTRDETILALDVYFDTLGKSPGPSDPAIIALSDLLRALPYHENAARKPTFRNADGAAFKVQNLRSLATNKGLKNVSRIDREVWAEFGDKPAEVKRLAVLIREGIRTERALLNPPSDDSGDDDEFYEGRQLTRLHRYRERRPELRRKLLSERRDTGLRCEVCGDEFAHLPPDLREAAFEAHHTIPIAAVGESRTKLKDMALLCATCHRLLHRAIAVQKTWLGIAEARMRFGKR